MFGILRGKKKKQTQHNANYFSLQRQQQHVLKKARERNLLFTDMLLRPMCIFREQETLHHFSKRQLTDNKISKHFIFNHCYKILSAPLKAPRQQNIPRSNWKQRGWKDDQSVHSGTDIQNLQISISFHFFFQKGRLEIPENMIFFF